MHKSKVIVVMPSHNVGGVLEKTVSGIPPGCVDEIIVVNDGSTDDTEQVARRLGLSVISHPKSRGYGATQKSGYKEAMAKKADLVIMVHGDNQYDPSLVPQFIWRITQEHCDVVTGTRMVLGDVLKNGMPLWKFIPNRALTWLENMTFRTNLSDYHNGYRAFTTNFLRTIPLDELSDGFDFDTDIIIQAAIRRVKIGEVPHVTRYKDENSQMPFSKGVKYGLSILITVFKFFLHRTGIRKQKLFAGL